VAQPTKHPVSGVWYLRRKLPDELREALGRRELRGEHRHDRAMSENTINVAFRASITER
jgi:hypothetical protein